ncbi:MAG: VWA domain-containing protein [Acidobacteria bacterium]|nr:VWA domain-containing protein [Acidobacteriota bacterium]
MSFVSAQQPFRSTTLLVEVDTIVTDAKGQFVLDLTTDDFEVLEEGTRQTIERMYVVNGRHVTAIPPPSAAPDAPVAQPSVPAIAPQRVFVLFFDEDHLNQSSIKRLKEAAERFLKTEFQPTDVGGVLIGTKMVGNRLTSDRDALVTAVRDLKLTPSQALRRSDLQDWPRMSEAEATRIVLQSDERVLNQVADRAKRETPEGNLSLAQEIDYRDPVEMKARTIVDAMRPAAARTLEGFQALLNGLGRLPGRKSVAFITDGFFVEESWAHVRQLVGVAARSNVRIYSIDAQGTSRRMPSVDPSLMMPVETGAAIQTETYNTVEEGPNTLAVDTGGYVFRSSNDFASALAGIARDSSNYYVIGYSPANPAADGSFRRITVRVKRQGLTVRARRGYLATAAPATTTAAPPVAPVSPSGASAPPVRPAAGAPESSDALLTADPAGTPASALEPSAVATPAVNLRPDSGSRVRELASVEGGIAASNSLASQGWERYQQGDLEGAADLLGRAVADRKGPAWVSYALGYSELGLRHFARAAEAWETVRATVPEFRTVYLDLADAYLQSESYGRALDVLKIADARWPGDMDILNATGTIQVRRGALDDAINTFTRATGAKPNDELAYFNLGRTYELRYFKMRRYSQPTARWMANPADLKSAIASYERYVKLGGPYETQAREAIQKLEWLK